MTKARLRGVLIGCGFFARNHMHGWKALEDVEIVAVCDRDEARAKAMAREFGIARFYLDAAAMLAEEKPDFADVATTVELHRPLVELVCNAGIGAICQKPFAETMADGEAMAAAAARAGAPLIVHENFRWQKPFVLLKSMIGEGKIGQPHFARLSFRHRFDVYANQPYLAEAPRLALMDVGLHLYDLSRFLMGETTHLACRTQRLNPKVKGEDAFTTLLTQESGAAVVCDASFFSRIDPEPFPSTVAWIEGERGTLELTADCRITLHGAESRSVIDAEPETPNWGAKPFSVVQDSVMRFEAHAASALRGEVAPQPSGQDNLRTLALALASYESARDKTMIDMTKWRKAAGSVARILTDDAKG